MTVYVAWAGADLPDDLPGPWVEVRPAADRVYLVESDESLSRVYHELKWALPHDTALLVVPVGRTPKLKGLAPGTTTWLRDRTRP